MKRTLKRELKVPEIAEKEPMGSSVGKQLFCIFRMREVCVIVCKFGFLRRGEEVLHP
jgi:hypothetical protein